MKIIAVQAGYATVFGIIAGIVYTLSGSIWPTVIVHSLYDIAEISMETAETAPDWPIFVDIAGLTLFMVGLLAFFLRNRKNAVNLWNKKWHNELPAKSQE